MTICTFLLIQVSYFRKYFGDFEKMAGRFGRYRKCLVNTRCFSFHFPNRHQTPRVPSVSVRLYHCNGMKTDGSTQTRWNKWCAVTCFCFWGRSGVSPETCAVLASSSDAGILHGQDFTLWTLRSEKRQTEQNVSDRHFLLTARVELIKWETEMGDDIKERCGVGGSWSAH